MTGIYKTEWIEHSDNFERVYRFHSDETDKPCYLVVEFHLDPEDIVDPPRYLSATCVHFYVYADENIVPEMEGNLEEEADEEGEREPGDQSYYVYPYMLCPFPSAVPAHIRDEFMGRPLLEFNFLYVKLWEKDAREFLNTHVSATYFLLPAMKNADATLLGLAIEELAQRFQHDEAELGRHLTGLNLMLHMSELMPEAEKLATQEHLKPYAHLIKSDPLDE